MREQGLVKKEVWILPENARQLAQVEAVLRQQTDEHGSTGVKAMTQVMETWTTGRLYDALLKHELFVNGKAVVELIDGIEPALHIVMTEYGDLPIFMTVSGEQIIAEAVLWSIDEVSDVAKFNDAVLRTHKYFPLSTISLDSLHTGTDYYHMFGALSSSSVLHNIVLEIEVLASNVIQATEAYSEFLTLSVDVG